MLDSGSKVIHALMITSNHGQATKKKRKQITQEKKDAQKSNNFVDGVYGVWKNPPVREQEESPLEERSIDELRLMCEERKLPVKGKKQKELIKMLQGK